MVHLNFESQPILTGRHLVFLVLQFTHFLSPFNNVFLSLILQDKYYGDK
jgi:hypothetical protein